MSLSHARELAAYWKDEYDWRAQEAKLNAFEQYSVPLKDIELHFIHERAASDDPVPILLLHGWPSSVWEFHKIIHLLTDDAGERGGFSVVVPSLPGYGFSFRPFQDRFGLVECADALSELMTGVLGYEEYVITAGDWGAHIGTRMAYTHPDAVLGLHLNMLPLRRDPSWPEHPSELPQGMRLMPTIRAPKTLRPATKRARKTALPPCRAKNASACPRRSGLIRAYRPHRSTNGRPPKRPTK
jgi:microsomal epoxide hydrolase